MKCFYHPETDATATCQRCGKFLCSSCSSVFAVPTCRECGLALLQSEYTYLSKWVKRSKIAAIIGAILGVFAVIPAALDEISRRGVSIGTIISTFFSGIFGWIFAIYLCFAFVWGWFVFARGGKVASASTSNNIIITVDYKEAFDVFSIMLIFKILIAGIGGIFVAPFMYIKTKQRLNFLVNAMQGVQQAY